jgi:hypothetical protein
MLMIAGCYAAAMAFMNGPDFNVISREGAQLALVLLKLCRTCSAQSKAVATQQRCCEAHSCLSKFQPAAVWTAGSSITTAPKQQAVCASRPDGEHKAASHQHAALLCCSLLKVISGCFEQYF